MIVPDGIEPVEEWRTWQFDGTYLLLSHNGEAWKPGVANAAVCKLPQGWKWSLMRGVPRTLEQAREETKAQNESAVSSSFGAFSYTEPRLLTAPTVEPPPGYGYALVSESHDAPREDCSCGIYAGRTPDDVPPGDVLGKVKLWGKIVPGTKGSRAEYAYPSELHVPASLADNPAILAYGVPVVVTDSEKVSGKSGYTFSMTTAGSFGASMAQASANFQGFGMAMGRKRWYDRWSVRLLPLGLNLGACALNLLVAFKVVKF